MRPRFFPQLWFYGLVFCALGANAWAEYETPIAVREETAFLNLSDGLELMLDSSGTLTLEQVMAAETGAQFQPVEGPRVHLGISSTPLWLRVKLVSPDYGINGVLTLHNPRLANVQCYVVGQDGSVTEMHAGTDYPFYSRGLLHPAPSFLLSLPEGEPRAVYVRVAHTGSVRFQVVFRSALGFHRYATEWTAYTFLILGTFLAVGFYNLFIFLSLRERAYLYCSLLILTFLLFQMSLEGTANMYLWPNFPWWASRSTTTLVLVALALATLFANTVLDGPRTAPLLSIILRVVGVLCVVVAVIGLRESVYKYFLSHTLGMVVPVLMFFLAIQSWRRGYRPARYFVLAWTIALLGSGMMALLGPGWVPSNVMTENLSVLGFLVAVFFWSFALTDRVKEREEAQRRVLQEEVAVRTEELGTALADVKALQGLLPICAQCKKIRDDGGYWNEVEHYLKVHADLGFSHSLCPVCVKTLYPQYYREAGEQN